MAGGVVNIALKVSGAGSVIDELGNVNKSIKGTANVIADLSRSAKVMAHSIGGFAGRIVDLAKTIFTGGLLEVGAKLVSMVYDTFVESSERVLEKAKEDAKKLSEAYGETLAEMKKSSEQGISEIDALLKKRKEEIDHIHKVAMAEKELEKQRASAAGNTKRVLEIENEQRELTKKNVADQLELEGESFEAKRAIAEKAAADAEAQAKYLENESWGSFKKLRSMSEEVKRSVREYNNLAFFREGEDPESLPKRVRARRIPKVYMDQEEAAIREAINKLHERSDWVAEDARHKALDTRAKEARKFADETKKNLEEMDDAEQMRLENAIAEENLVEAKAVKERQKAELAAAQDVAKERARLEGELHKQRMDDLRKEIAAQKDAATPLRAVAAAAQSEFDKAFAMYRDPSRAAAEIGEEKDYRSDLNRLHRDARRYGAKWRIDELSSLMAAGDTRGVSDTLAEWRKNKGFTPEVEAMVRASAAENAKTTVEDELRKIETNTAGLDKKLDELLSMK